MKFNVGDFVKCTNTNKVGGEMWKIGIVIGYDAKLKKYTIAIPYQMNVHDVLTKEKVNIGYFAQTWREDCLTAID